MKKLYIVILSFKAEKELVDCLKSLKVAKIPAGWQVKIEVIDNNQRNRGFSAGCNLGIRRALKNGAAALLLLNQDTVVEKGFLGPLLANPEEIVAPIIKFKRRGKWIYDCGGKINWWLGRTKHIEKLSIIPARPAGGNFQFLIPDYVSGCAMLIRRKVLEKIGLLDEQYFLYFEDVDFCLRASRAGFKIAVEPKSVIIHKLSEKKSISQRRQLIKSNLIFINHWILPWRRPLAWLYWLVISVKILLR